MSFGVVCSSCGAPSSPSVGICPYCKAVQTSAKGAPENPGITAVRKAYREGKLQSAVTLAMTLNKEKPEALEKGDAAVLYAKILLESEGPTTWIRSALSKALLQEPDHAEVAEYLEIVEAKSKLSREKDDLGEQSLRAILRRSPKNPHALFELGAHLAWVESQLGEALKLMEACVKARPEFLRAWGCLGAIYLKLDNKPLARRSFMNAYKLETEPKMKAFFREQLGTAN